MKTTVRFSILAFVLAAMTFLAALTTHATLLVYEGFNYTAGTALTNSSVTAPDVGTGWAGPWGTAGAGQNGGGATNLNNSMAYTDAYGQVMYTTGGKCVFGITNGTTANYNLGRCFAIGSLVTIAGNVYSGMGAGIGATTNTFWVSYLAKFTNGNGFQSTTNLFARKGAVTFRSFAQTNGPGSTAAVNTGNSDILDLGRPNVNGGYTNLADKDNWVIWRNGDGAAGAATTNNSPFGGGTTKALTNLSWVLIRMDINGLNDSNDVAYTFINWTNLNVEPPLGAADRTNAANLTSNNAVRLDINGGNANGTNAAIFLDEFRVGTTFSDVAAVDPYITSQPASVATAPGQTATFSVAASTAFPSLTYQWKKNGVDLTDGGNVFGATTSSLTLTGITAGGDNGSYSCGVTNAQPQGTLTADATLSVIDPAILSQPVSITKTNGDTATFSVTAGGTPAFSYQWRKNGVDISGATDSTLTLPLVSYLDTASYTVVVTNTGPQMSITSSVATLTVRDPWILVGPSSLIRSKGEAGSITVVVTSSVPASLVYQWRNGTTAQVDGGNRAGGSTSSLNFASAENTNAITATLDFDTTAGVAAYNVTVSNNVTAPAQLLTSGNANLTVVEAPRNQTVASGLPSVTLLPTVNGTNATAVTTYQWYSNGVAISGATSRIYYASNTVAGFSASYSVDVSNADGTRSGTGVLSVVTGNVVLYPTNLVVLRGGEGTENSSASSGTSIFLDQYTTNGTYVNTVSLPNTGSTPFAINAILSTASIMSRSMDGRLLTIPCYDTNSSVFGIGMSGSGVGTIPGTIASLDGAASTTVPRIIATVNGLGQIDRPYKSTALFSGAPFRSVTSDGTNNFWGTSSINGHSYLTPPSSITAILTDKTDLRGTHIYGDSLYFAARVTTTDGKQGIYQYTAGRPTTLTGLIAGTTNIGNFGALANANDFDVDPAFTTLFASADGNSHIRKYTNNAGVWSLAYTLTNFNGMLNGTGPRFMMVDWSGPTPVVYCVASTQGNSGFQNRLYRLDDTGALSQFKLIAQAPQNQNFRAVRLAPVSLPPAVASDPSSATNCSGTDAILSVSAGGTAPLSYQWQKNGVDLSNGGNISGATTTSLTVSSVGVSDAATYTVVVGGFGSVTSAPAVLTVITPPSVTTDPVSASLADGDTTNLTVVADLNSSYDGTTYTPVPATYQWRKNGVDLTDGGAISGALTDGLTISTAHVPDSGSYDVVIANACGSDTSAVAVVTVSCPTITVSPPTLPNGVQYTLYSAGVSGSGSSAVPYTYTAVGILPDGVVLNSSSGGISGIASNSGPFVFDIVATDTNGCSGTQSYSLSITSAAPDTSLPTVKFNTTPPNNAGVTTSPTNITGTAKDVGTAGIQEVVYSLNGGPTNNATTLSIGTGGNSNWTASVAMVPGTNSVTIQARDKANNLSTVASTHTRKYFLSVAGTYTLAIIGDGTVAGTLVSGDPANPGTSGAPLKIGRKYTVTATAGANYLFTNWTISVDGGPTTVATASNKYSFTMSSNVVLSANFITNNFIGAAGKYYGLYNDIGVAHQSAGWFTVKTDSKQKFSGKLLVQGEVVAISGTFNQAGHGTLKPGKVFARKGLTNYPIVVALDLALDGSDVITGTVTNAEGWEATMSGDRATFSLTSPATNYLGSNGLGQYTFVYPGSLSAATEPGGDGYGLVQLGADGKVKPTGGRAGDYHLLKSTVTSISKNGAWPFYAPMYVAAEARTSPAFTAKTYKGSTFGWLYFSNNTVSGDLFWNKVSWTNGYYNSGFTNTQTIIGSGYIKPPVNNRVLTNVTTMTALLADGNLVDTVTNNAYLALNNNIFFTNAIPPVNPRGIKGKVSTAKGEFSGSFTNSALSVKSLIKGVVLQDTVEVRGVFLGTNNSGSIRITP